MEVISWFEGSKGVAKFYWGFVKLWICGFVKVKSDDFGLFVVLREPQQDNVVEI